MLAVVEAMISYDVPRDCMKVLSIGYGDEPYRVIRRMMGSGLPDNSVSSAATLSISGLATIKHESTSRAWAR